MVSSPGGVVAPLIVRRVGDEVSTYMLKAPCTGEPATAIELGGQYVIGITGPCAWRKGEFVSGSGGGGAHPCSPVPEHDIPPRRAPHTRAHAYFSKRQNASEVVWGLGRQVYIADVPPRFLEEYMMNGASSCPIVNTSGGGSVLLVFVVIVIAPCSMVLLWAVLHYLGTCPRQRNKI